MALLSEKAEDAPRGRRAAPRFGATAARILRRARRPRAVDVRLADKLSYVLGVCGCSLTQGVFVQAPEHMWLLYALAIGPLLAVRTAMYRAARQAIFMLDFCYAVQALLLLHIFKLPCSRGLHFALFALSSGPLALAIVAWRNSLVFHSIDKVTSIFIHLLPVATMHALHWHPASVCPSEPPGWRAEAALPLSAWLGAPLAIYAAWQLCYVLAVDVALAGALRSDRRQQTSVRLLTAQPYGHFAAATLRACRRLRIFESEEHFDPDGWKTKLVFMATQAAYTLVTLLPTGLGLARSRRAHAALIAFLLIIAVWNGAGYYFEIFSRRYEAELLGREEAALRELASVAGEAAGGVGGQRSGAGQSERGGSANLELSALSDSLRALADEAGGGALAAAETLDPEAAPNIPGVESMSTLGSGASAGSASPEPRDLPDAARSAWEAADGLGALRARSVPRLRHSHAHVS